MYIPEARQSGYCDMLNIPNIDDDMVNTLSNTLKIQLPVNRNCILMAIYKSLRDISSEYTPNTVSIIMQNLFYPMVYVNVPIKFAMDYNSSVLRDARLHEDIIKMCDALKVLTLEVHRSVPAGILNGKIYLLTEDLIRFRIESLVKKLSKDSNLSI
jgi:hypothetical protein